MTGNWQGPSLGLVLAAIMGLAVAGGARAEDPKPAQPQEQTKAAAKHRSPPSICVGLTESACGTKSECWWRKAITTKAGKSIRAHCRKKTLRFARKTTAN